MKVSILPLSVLLLFTVTASAQTPAKKKIRFPPIVDEVSGLYIENDSTFWLHNDSGGAPSIYAFDQEGNLKEQITIPGATNKDWEDLTVDDQGRLYIGDFGNNCNCRQDPVIYRYDPSTKAVDQITFNYPDQTEFPPKPAYRNYDMEAFLWWQDTLHLFSKNRLWAGNYITKHYTLPAQPGNYTAQLKDSLYLKKRVVTAAAISPDGQTVALLAYYFKRWLGFFPSSRANVFLFREFEGSDFLKGKRKKKRIRPFFLATQYESLDFLNENYLYVASEKTLFITPRAKRLKY